MTPRADRRLAACLILDNASVVKYLSQRYPDILSELQKLAEAPDFKGAG